MALNQGKYKPAISSIDEVDDGVYRPESEFVVALSEKQQIEGSETAPLTTHQQKTHIQANDRLDTTPKDVELGIHAASSVADDEQPADGNGAARTGTAATSFYNAMNGLRERVSFDALAQLTQRQRLLYALTASALALFIVLLLLALIFWPEVPYHYRAPICREPECMRASQQLLRWANTAKPPCNDTYEWACGHFQRDYIESDYYALKHGEWNYKSYNEYQELNELHQFVSTLPPSGNSFTVESLITNLYRSCRVIDELDKSQSILLLKTAINSVDGLAVLQNFDPKKALVHLHASFGIFPLFKVSVQNRYTVPHEYIIKIEEGELGLPGKYFYNEDEEAIRAYQLLLRDFAIIIGEPTTEADRFADGVFHYEKRIVNALAPIKLNGQRQLNKIVTLSELKSIAASLPIAETLNAMFAKTKLSGDTEVMLGDVEVLQQLSLILSTSDKKPIKDLIVWSLARQMLPHLSSEYRQLVENFERAIYKRSASYPSWLSCARVVRDWVPLAVDALQQRPKQLQHAPTPMPTSRNATYGNEQLLNMIFGSVRAELLTTLQRSGHFDEAELKFLREKLISMRLQFGIPNEVYEQRDYVKNYYSELLLHNMYFVQFRTPFWNFRKSRMESKLDAQNSIDTMISEMYTHDTPPTIYYSEILNMVFVSRGIVFSQYYDYRYPLAVNFARIGGDLLETLIAAIGTFVQQYSAERQYAEYAEQCGTKDYMRSDIALCLDAEQLDAAIEPAALERLNLPASATKIAARALSTFMRAIDDDADDHDNEHVVADAALGGERRVTYAQLGLLDERRARLAGLRELDENRLYALASLQKHCAANTDDDVAVEERAAQLSERIIFKFIWQQIQFLSDAVGCYVEERFCANLL